MKYTQQVWHEKLSKLLDEFPRVDGAGSRAGARHFVPSFSLGDRPSRELQPDIEKLLSEQAQIVQPMHVCQLSEGSRV